MFFTARYFYCIGILSFTLLFLPGRHAGASQLWVSPTGTDSGNDCLSSLNPCATIQHALDLSVNNDMEAVEQGTYIENIVLSNKAIAGLTVRGGYSCGSGTCLNTPDPTLTIIDGGGNGSVVDIGSLTGAVDAVFEYLTIRNGSASGIRASGGAGFPSRITVSDSIIANNSATNAGGGALVEGNDITLEIVHSSVHHNSAVDGGGLALECNTVSGGATNTGLIVKQQSTIQNNTASSEGGGVYVHSTVSNCRPRLLFQDSTVGTLNVQNPADNPAGNSSVASGGGISLRVSGGAQADADITGSVINGNTSSHYGSGISVFLDGGSTLDFLMSDSFLTWNGTAASWTGGGIHASSLTGGALSLTLIGNTVSGNNSGANGGIYIESSSAATVDIERNLMFWNGGGQNGSFDLRASGGGSLTARFRGNDIGLNDSGLRLRSYDTGSLLTAYLENTFLINHALGTGLEIWGVSGSANVSVINSTVSANALGIYVWAAAGGNAHAVVRNSISWGNGIGGDIAISDDGTSVSTVRAGTSDLQTIIDASTFVSSGYADLGGNIASDPLFVNTAGYNYDIGVSSPARDKAVCDEQDGFGNVTRIAPLIDFEGNPRPPSPTQLLLCDMGADEIDHCIDGTTNFDETGLDCGGSRCAPCGCIAGPNHVQLSLTGYPSINDAYAAIAGSGTYALTAHKMEFSPGSAFTKTAGGQPINVKISGGFECNYTTRASPNDHTTIYGKVIVGGDTTIEADHIGIR